MHGTTLQRWEQGLQWAARAQDRNQWRNQTLGEVSPRGVAAHQDDRRVEEQPWYHQRCSCRQDLPERAVGFRGEYKRDTASSPDGLPSATAHSQLSKTKSELLACILQLCIKTRCKRLQDGEAHLLWNDQYKWTARISSEEIDIPTPLEMASQINRDISRASPARGFHRQTDAPFMPPCEKAAILIAKKLVTHHNTDLDDHNLPSIAAAILPPQPFPSAKLTADETVVWHTQQSTHPKGAPGGSGQRKRHLLTLTSTLPLLVQWLTALHRHTSSRPLTPAS